MKIKNTHKKYSKMVIAIAAVVIVAIVVAILLIIFFNSSPKNQSTTSSKSNPAISSDQNITNKGQTKTDPSVVDSGKTTDQVPVNSSATASITQLTQSSNGDVLFSGTVNGASKGGKCSVIFTNANDKPYAPDAFDGTTQGSSTICGPLKVSNFNFSSLGTWDVTFRYYVDDQQVTTSGKIDIEQ